MELTIIPYALHLLSASAFFAAGYFKLFPEYQRRRWSPPPSIWKRPWFLFLLGLCLGLLDVLLSLAIAASHRGGASRGFTAPVD